MVIIKRGKNNNMKVQVGVLVIVSMPAIKYVMLLLNQEYAYNACKNVIVEQRTVT